MRYPAAFGWTLPHVAALIVILLCTLRASGQQKQGAADTAWKPRATEILRIPQDEECQPDSLRGCINRTAARLDAVRNASLSLLSGRNPERRDSLLADAKRLYALAQYLDSILLQRCEKLLRTRGAAAARDEFGALAEKWPDEIAFHLYLARSLELIPDTAAALDAYTRILRKHPAEKRAHLALGRLQERKGELRESRLSYKRAFAIDRSDSAACIALIRLSEKTNSTAELIEDWLVQARIHPGNLMLLRNLQQLLERSGRDTEAASIREQLRDAQAPQPEPGR